MRLIIAGVLVAAVAACGSADISEPAPAGALQFEARGQSYTVSGFPSTDPRTLLSAPFAIAYADSLDGFAIIGYEQTAENVGNLIVLQAPRLVGRFECSDAADACDLRAEQWHGRYITGVHDRSTVGADRYFDLISGTLVVTQVGPDRLRATFAGVFRASDSEPDNTITIDNGSVDLPYVTSEALAALLHEVHRTSAAVTTRRSSS